MRFAGAAVFALLFATVVASFMMPDDRSDEGSVALPNVDGGVIDSLKLSALSGKNGGASEIYEVRSQVLFALYWKLIDLENSLVKVEGDTLVSSLWQAGDLFQLCYEAGFSGYASNVCRVRARFMHEQAVLISNALGRKGSDYEGRLKLARESDSDWYLSYEEAVSFRVARLRKARAERDRSLPPTESERLDLDRIERRDIEVFSEARKSPLEGVEISALSGNINSAKKLHLAAKESEMIGVAMFWGMVSVENSILCNRAGRSSECEEAAQSIDYFCRFLRGVAGVQNKVRAEFWCEGRRNRPIYFDETHGFNEFIMPKGFDAKGAGYWGEFWGYIEK